MKHYVYMGYSHDQEIARHLSLQNICYSFHKTCRRATMSRSKSSSQSYIPSLQRAPGTSPSRLRFPNRARRLKRQVPGSNPEKAIYYHGYGMLVFSNLPGKSHISFCSLSPLLVSIV